MRPDESLPFVVKVCGITNEADAVAAIEAGANALGFNFYEKSPRWIAPESAARITSQLPPGILRVGVLVNARLDRILNLAEQAALDVVQLHGRHAPNTQLRTWRAIAAGHPVPPLEPPPEAYLIDSYFAGYGGSGETFDWELVTRYSGRVILAGGLDAQNVGIAIRVARPWGVDACSRLESSLGRKDCSRVRDFVQAALEAWHALPATII